MAKKTAKQTNDISVKSFPAIRPFQLIRLLNLAGAEESEPIIEDMFNNSQYSLIVEISARFTKLTNSDSVALYRLLSNSYKSIGNFEAAQGKAHDYEMLANKAEAEIARKKLENNYAVIAKEESEILALQGNATAEQYRALAFRYQKLNGYHDSQKKQENMKDQHQAKETGTGYKEVVDERK